MSEICITIQTERISEALSEEQAIDLITDILDEMSDRTVDKAIFRHVISRLTGDDPGSKQALDILLKALMETRDD